MASSSKFEDLDLSHDEVKRLGEALKNEEFRKLFVEYAEEISDPENRKRYEEEIKQLENEKGMDVQFIHPKPGHVLKTSINGNTKAFINICQSDKIKKPTSERQISPDGRRGLNWQIPHSHVPPRDDVDKSKGKCKVFDVVFHPDTYRMAENERFRKLVEDTAIDGIERQFDLKVDRNNIKRLANMKFKGVPTASVIRSRKPEGASVAKDDILNNIPYPYDDETSEEKAKTMAEKVKGKKKQGKTVKFDDSEEPKYTIIHRSDMDLQEYTNARDSRPSTRPKELEIKIFLPLLTSAGQAELDVFEQKLVLKSTEPAKYKLDLKLPYPVDDEHGSAKFDKSKKCLVVTLPVIPDKVPNLMNNGDEIQANGVEGQNNDPAGPLIEEISNTPANDSEAEIDEPPPLEEVPEEEIEAANLRQNEDEETLFEKEKPKVMEIAYSCPDFTFSQDQGAISFVLSVRNVKVENITKTFSSKNMMHIRLVSIGDGGFPLHYSLYVQFSEDHTIVPEHCSVDVSDMNVVVLLLKERSSRGIWDGFKAGSAENNLQEFLFMTESNLQRELAELEAEAALQKQNQNAAAQTAPVIQVTDMTQKRLQIDIKKAGSAEDKAEEEDEVPSSSEIQVVHEKAMPNLHGILKQRSMSESSECDGYGSSSNSSGSPSSPRDDLFGLRKSVSFNERVDKTTFKPGMAVTAMTSTLKNKRKRNRKREEKRKSRTRNNSGGSEGSSDDLDHRNSTGESHSENDDESEESVSKATTISTIEEEEVKKPTREVTFIKNVKEKLSKSENGDSKEDDSDDDDGDDDKDNMRTKVKENKSVNVMQSDGDNDNHERTKGVEEEIKSECVQNAVSENVREIEANENQQAAKEGPTNLKEAAKKKGQEDIAASAKDVISHSGVQDFLEENKTVIKVTADERGSGDDSGVECGTEGNADDKSSPGNNVETMLSWNDTPSNEHATKCSFQFSNAVMFDLDVD